MRIAPAFNMGVSVDQSRTAIDVPLALQTATLDLTQLGFNASLDKGPWTWALAAAHGFGNVNSRRDESRIRICPIIDRRVAGVRRLGSGDGDGRLCRACEDPGWR
jgi:hypothetical protein